LQDGLEAGILTPRKLQGLDLWQEVEGAVRQRYGDLSEPLRCRQAIRHLIDRFVTDVVECTGREIESRGIVSWRDALRQEDNVVRFSREVKARKDALEEFLHQTLYMDYRVVRVTNSARRFVEGIFGAHVGDPRQLPPQYGRWADEVGVHRAVCDYIAGMTDRYAQDQYMQLFHPYQKL
ncbi:MAG: hypothetical protein KAX19_08260, partial [Candidatus Brocadiae bacterium]|nr:hypothetical protein [Candidatus Brocadiia bacterium]